MVFIRKTYPFAVSVEHVNMAATTQRARRKRRHDVARFKRYRNLWAIALHNNTTPMARAILPVVCRVLWSQDERHSPISRAERSDAAAGPILRAINFAHLVRIDV